MSIKIATVLGARPQFIKSQPLSSLFADDGDVEEIIIHTGQHYDMAMYQNFLKELRLPEPNYYLGVSGGTNVNQLSKMLTALEDVYLKEKPDAILVYGDTNSTLAGALCAKQLQIPVFHIEAGLRSHNWNMAEELNRVITDKISNLLFTPVKEADENLEKEGMYDRVHNVGDVLFDVLSQNSETIDAAFESIKVNIKSGDYVFLTMHRAELVDSNVKLKATLEVLEESGFKYVLPIHPRTKKNIENFGLTIPTNIKIIEPTAYFSTLALIKNSKFVVTDSGGVQREAYMLNKKCLTLRDETEWLGTLIDNCNELISTNPDKIKHALNQHQNFEGSGSEFPKIFGSGNASAKILSIIKKSIKS